MTAKAKAVSTSTAATAPTTSALCVAAKAKAVSTSTAATPPTTSGPCVAAKAKAVPATTVATPRTTSAPVVAKAQAVSASLTATVTEPNDDYLKLREWYYDRKKVWETERGVLQSQVKYLQTELLCIFEVCFLYPCCG